MIIVEDLHWIDSESEALFNLMVDSIATARVLLLVSYRPEWGSRTHHTQLRLGAVRLTRPLDQLRIPPTVQAILAARIDRLLPPENELLQTLAVIGKEFSLELVREVLRKSNDHL
jgi:predicted ATPase